MAAWMLQELSSFALWLWDTSQCTDKCGVHPDRSCHSGEFYNLISWNSRVELNIPQPTFLYRWLIPSHLPHSRKAKLLAMAQEAWKTCLSSFSHTVQSCSDTLWAQCLCINLSSCQGCASIPTLWLPSFHPSCQEHFSWWHRPKKLLHPPVPTTSSFLPFFFLHTTHLYVFYYLQMLLHQTGLYPNKPVLTILCWKCISVPNIADTLPDPHPP